MENRIILIAILCLAIQYPRVCSTHDYTITCQYAVSKRIAATIEGDLGTCQEIAPSTLADVTLTVADFMSKKLAAYAAIGVIRTAIVAIPSNNLFLVMESNSTILNKSNIIKNMNNFAEICSV